jgi:hypothetical protein
MRQRGHIADLLLGTPSVRELHPGDGDLPGNCEKPRREGGHNPDGPVPRVVAR